MMTYREAKQKVTQEIGIYPSPSPGDSLALVEEETIEKPYGWIFFYTSKLWMETQETRYAIAGNSPILVEKGTGRLVPLGTSGGVESGIERYEEGNHVWELWIMGSSNPTLDSLLPLKHKFGTSYEKILRTHKGSDTCIESGGFLRIGQLRDALMKEKIEAEIRMNEELRKRHLV